MALKKEHLLMMALSPKKGGAPDPADDDQEADTGDSADEGTDEDYGDEDSPDADAVDCAHDALDAIRDGDAEKLAEAIRAIAGK